MPFEVGICQVDGQTCQFIDDRAGTSHLVVRWSGGGVNAAAVAATDIQRWVDGQTARANAAPKVPRETSQKTVAARERSVAEGLDQLDIWIEDQIRNGIAGIRADPYAGWSEPIAKRMVDAKAPGLARWLRALPGHLAHDDWPQLIIEELGLMRLLTDTFQAIETVPAETAAAARRRIGFTVSRAEVLATEPVEDTWQVLGYAETLEDRFTTRRMWLSGKDTGLLVNAQATAASGEALDARLIPGRELTGGLWWRCRR